jgi:hypothetical protein
MNTEDISLDYLRTVLEAAKTLQNADTKACFVAAMHYAADTQELREQLKILRLDIMGQKQETRRAERDRDEALKANCNTTTVDQIATVAKQLSTELRLNVRVGYSAEYSNGSMEKSVETPQFEAVIMTLECAWLHSVTARTLPELAAAVRKWWAERQRTQAQEVR